MSDASTLADLWPSETYPRTAAGRATAVILGPVAPEWQGAGFCRPLLGTLTDAGYDVHVVDSIAPLLSQVRPSPDAMLGTYRDLVVRTTPAPDLIAGYAIGGTLAMALASNLPSVTRVLSLSGPGFADDLLSHELIRLLARLSQDDLTGSLRLLAASVAPKGTQPNADHIDQVKHADPDLAIARMTLGFRLLLGLDARPPLRRFQGRTLALTGALSQLATADNLGGTPDQAGQFRHVEIEQAGMRVLFDNPAACIEIIKNWLDENE